MMYLLDECTAREVLSHAGGCGRLTYLNYINNGSACGVSCTRYSQAWILPCLHERCGLGVSLRLAGFVRCLNAGNPCMARAEKGRLWDQERLTEHT